MRRYLMINHATKERAIVEANSAQEAAKKVGYRIKEDLVADIGQPKLSGIPIPKAIEILEELPGNLNQVLGYDQEDAIKLSIEALKRIKHIRTIPHNWVNTDLPGETEE